MDLWDIDNFKHLLEQYIPFHKLIGIKLVEVRKGYASILIPYKPELVGDPRVKRIHGGVISTAMDAAGGAAGMTTLSKPEDQIATIDIRVDYLHPGKPEDIICEGQIVRDGSAVIFTKMTAHHRESNELIAEARAIYRVKRL